MKRYFSTIFLMMALLLVLPSCSVEQRIGDAREDLMEKYHNLPKWQSLPVKEIGWEKALALLENNLELQNARLQVKKAKQDRDDVYKDFIPLVDLGYYFNTALLKSNSYYSRDSSFDVNVIFSLPAITRLPIDHYTRSLALFRAEKNLELKRRELVARLWQVFRQNELDRNRREMEDAGTDTLTADMKLRRHERELQDREQSQRLCALLNDYTARWVPKPSTLPKVNWQNYRKLALVPDELTQTKMALILESARLRKLGVGMRYLPNVRLNFYSPTLFSISGGSTEGFMSGAEDIRLNLNAYMQLDSRLETWSDWAIVKENYHLVQQDLTRQMYDYRNKMELLVDSWKAYDEWLTSTRAYIEFRRSQGVCDPQSVQELYKEDLQLQKEIQDQAAKNLERECALIQEYGMPDQH